MRVQKVYSSETREIDIPKIQIEQDEQDANDNKYHSSSFYSSNENSFRISKHISLNFLQRPLRLRISSQTMTITFQGFAMRKQISLSPQMELTT
ncbi:hypothetical protein FGO68_gene16194 [Halteria grandinella]|uniref:Uncharacterized protein n=1 Tax=Halteria grandinella TaxID=5974 RepID=A0A8J8P6J0_HALGN|nr:hypothetical protein FGO68_gene16194 [Halteria grandinella]